MQFAQTELRVGRWEEGQIAIIQKSLDNLLSMAHRYRDDGKKWQAIEIYWKLSEEHAGTQQALDSQQSLLELAETYERDDAPHLARAVYERLAQLPEHPVIAA